MNRIAQTRAKGQLSQVVLADALGWSQGRLSNYESDRRVPSLMDSRAIVAALNCLGIECGLDDVFPPDVSNAA
jgi:putative transcriptional regulator